MSLKALCLSYYPLFIVFIGISPLENFIRYIKIWKVKILNFFLTYNLRNVFVFGSILTLGKKKYPRVSACIFHACSKTCNYRFLQQNIFQDDMKAGTSTDLFQNNKIFTASRSKICGGDVHVLRLIPYFYPLS